MGECGQDPGPTEARGVSVARRQRRLTTIHDLPSAMTMDARSATKAGSRNDGAGRRGALGHGL